jgi:hypothetical protein
MATPGMSPSSISSSNRLALTTFGKRVLLFCVPLLLIICFFEFALFRAGESWPVSSVAHLQLHGGTSPTLFARLLFSEHFPLYKYTMLALKHPKILIFGTSRVMQVRDFMFHPLEQVFYNAGGMIQSVYDVETYARLIQQGATTTPEVIIIGADPWWMKQGPLRARLYPGAMRDETTFLAGHVEAARRLLRIRTFPWDALLTGAPRRTSYYGYQAIGAAAIYYEGGFRDDGSLQLTPEIILESIRDPRHQDRGRPPIIDRITQQKMEFEPPTVIDPVRLTVFVDALARLQQLGVEVYVFLPPFSDRVTAVWENSATWADFWYAYRGKLPAQLHAAGIFCLPLSVPTQDGFDDQYMYDGYHPSEIYVAAIMKQILQHVPRDSFLRQVDLAHLEALLSRDHISPLSFEIPPGRFP